MGYTLFTDARRKYEAHHTREERMKLFVEYALLAPSPLNTQPWIFRIRGDAIELYVDRRRVPAEAGGKSRLLYVSAGAALRYLETALTCTGVPYHIQLFPNFSDWDLIASVHLWARRFSEQLSAGGPPAFGVGEPPAVSPEIIAEIARKENVHIRPITSKQDIEAVIELARRAYLVNASGPGREGRPSAEVAEGLHDNGVAAAHPDQMIDPLLLNQTQELPEQMLLISSFADNVVSRVMAGMALGSLQILYQPDGYALYTFNELVDVEHDRARLHEWFNADRYPQLLISIRKTAETKPLPRRPVVDMIR